MSNAVTSLGWRRSSRCDSSACVEVVAVADGVMMRDSKTFDGPVLKFTHVQWAEFVAAMKAGDLSVMKN